jgi:splicing factor 3B subunit 1
MSCGPTSLKKVRCDPGTNGCPRPVRKVREVYWRVFNSLYIYNADSPLAGHPVIEDEGDNTYARTTMELSI